MNEIEPEIEEMIFDCVYARLSDAHDRYGSLDETKSDQVIQIRIDLSCIDSNRVCYLAGSCAAVRDRV